MRLLPIILCVLAAQLVHAAPATMPVDTLRDRSISVLIPAEPENRKTLHETAHKVADALKPEGAWPDIDYTNQQRSRWPMGNHLQRVLVMAKSYHLAREPALKQKIDLALNHWFERDYQNPNWWWNEIGVPQLAGEILILLAPDYSEAQFSKTIEILHRAKWEKWTGQNLVWGVSIQIQRGILQHDEKAIADAYARMFQEVRITSEEGIQHDYSFHQHGRQLYNGGYGLAFSSDVGRQIALSWDTPWQVPPEKLDIYLDYLLKGQAWMMWDNIFDYNAVGRQIARPGTSAVPKTWNANGPVSPVGAAYSLGSTLHLLTQIRDMPQREKLIDFADRLRQKPNAIPRAGNKYFWRSDYMTHRRTSWFIGLKMLSDRMINAELVNDEGKKSHHLSEGTTYIYRSGEEYRDIFAAWDWRQIPGTTAEQFELQRDGKEIKFAGQTSFVGGVSDGSYGMACMQLKRRELTGQKAWFFFDDEMVALGTGITNSSEIPVVTTVNQCLLRGQVARGNIPTARYRWLHHDGVGYLFPNSTTTPPDLPRITLSTEARSGAWTDIGPGPERTDTRRIFNLHLEHGAHPTDSRYVYIVLPNAATDDVARWAQRPPIELLANSNAHQAIYHKTLKMVMAAFAQPGEVQTPLGAIGVDQPCLLIVRGDKLTVSNPLNKPLTVQVTVNGKAQTVTLPDGPLAGSSVKLSL